jgi:hypothetical protein
MSLYSKEEICSDCIHSHFVECECGHAHVCACAMGVLENVDTVTGECEHLTTSQADRDAHERWLKRGGR